MTNDTSINRSSPSDAVVASPRKKQNAQGFDLSQQSFFEELLTIGQFESTIPQATDLPAIKPSADDGKKSDADKEVSRESDKEPTRPDEASNASEAQAVLAAQAVVTQIQPTTSQANKESSAEDKGERPLLRAVNQKHADEQADDKQAAPSVSAADTKSSIADASNQNPVSPVIVENPTANQAEVKSDESATLSPDTGANATDDQKSLSQAVQKSRGAADSSTQDGDQSKKESDKPQLASGQTESSPRPGIALKEFEANNQTSQDSVKVNASEGLVDQPRNRRSERLAQRASDGGSSTDDREPTVDPTLELRATQAVTPIETELTTSTTLDSSLPSSLGVSASTPTVVVQPVVTNGAGTTTVSSTKSNVENISSVTSSRAGNVTQTGVSNTTISGNVASPGRAEQARGGDVARSNSGTQISAYQEAKLVQRVLRGIEQLANGGGQVRLRLHPPELGALQMSLRMEGGQVFAKLEVENTTARDALLNNVQTLKDRMADQGMKVASFEVSVSTDSAGSGLGSSSSQADGSSGNQSRWENSSSRFAQQNSNRLPTEPTQAERKPSATWTRTNGSLDLTV